ncbi:MAG TPA: hypothetical protein VMN76_03200 [Acidobacteriota bacterium]|nr:hypothetical protein [Acidobacteriota bacterium]
MAGASSQDRPTAWRALVEQDPAIADDASVDWRQRLILHLLTPRQAEAYFSGRATADELMLSDGRTLAAALDQPTTRAGGVYVPLPVSCRLFAAATDDPGAGGAYAKRSFRLGEFNLSAQGIGALQPRIKLWAEGLPEPAAAAMERSAELAFEDRTATAIVNLCAGAECGPAGLRLKSSYAAAVQADLIGYFRPLSAADGAGPRPIFPFALESDSNNFFGTGAGANTTGPSNSFFGGGAGHNNTTGFSNSFFGRDAGFSNTEGAFQLLFRRRRRPRQYPRRGEFVLWCGGRHLQHHGIVQQLLRMAGRVCEHDRIQQCVFWSQRRMADYRGRKQRLFRADRRGEQYDRVSQFPVRLRIRSVQHQRREQCVFRLGCRPL